MTQNFHHGLIIKAQSGFFTVETGQGLILCQLRGKLKQGKALGDIAALGDRVKITVLQPAGLEPGDNASRPSRVQAGSVQRMLALPTTAADGVGVIEEIEGRHRALVRLDPRPKGIYQQVLLANPDQAVFVFACAQPDPRLRMLDRYLVIAEKQTIPAVIVANKIDLVKKPEDIFGLYAELGYRVLYTSIKIGAGLDQLNKVLAGKVSALAGPSGVGKSSLLNAIQPGLGLAVKEVSAAMNKGKHTTVVREMFRLEQGGYVADTPGWRSLALWDTEPEELDGYFRELAPLAAECQFSDCTHTHEPGCAVLSAVQKGKIHPQRYESYLRLRAGQE